MPLFSARAEFGFGMTMRISIVFACACLAPLAINVAFSAGQPQQHNRAIADLDRAVRIDPTHAPVYSNRGWTHYVKHDYARALADLYRALDSAPEFYNRASMYFDTGDIQRALSDYSAAIRLDPSNALYYNDRGVVYQLMRDYEHALADYSRAIELNPTYVTAYNNRGMLYYGNKEYDRATADHEQALKINPKSASAYRNLGNAHRAKGELDRAIVDYSEAIRIDPKDVRSYFGRGRLYLYAGAPAKADDDLGRARNLTPNDVYVALWLDIARRRNGHESFISVVVAQIDMAAWPAPLVRLYLEQRTPEEVLAFAEKADGNVKKRELCEAEFFGGEFLLARNNKAEASRMFRLAIAECPPNYPEFEGASEELKALSGNP
jgi:tetratricopeptide (TPR) repeat protein